MPRVFYRLISAYSPSTLDFLSKEPLRDDSAENRCLWRGISVYATESQARRKLRASPMLGRFIARIELPDDSDVASERTTASSGHHTLWGEASVILACVTQVLMVGGRSRDA